MSESNHMKLRTTIMVASMIVLPLAAVIGFRWPWLSAATKTASRPSHSSAAAKSSTAPAPNWNGGAEPVSTPPGAAADPMVVQAGAINHADNPNYHVVQATNNDVPGADRQRAGSGGDHGGAPASPAAAYGDEAAIRPLPVPTESGDPFVQIQQRLRGLGATHYSLETCGPQGEAYRFQCRMSAGHNLHYSRHFEATDVDPVRVMQTVLNDVEAWKSGRLP